MRPSRMLVIAAALNLGAALSVVPLQVAGAQSPSTSVLVPANGATVSGSQVILDAGASAGVTQVYFALSYLGNSPIRPNATPTLYGWITSWNSTTVPNGTYSLESVAIEGSSSTTSPSISITVNNPPPSVSLVVPSSGGAVSGNPAVLDAFASPGVSQVTFDLLAPGCPNVSTTFPPIYICAIAAVPTLYGWIGVFDSAEWANGSYQLYTVAEYPSGQMSAPAMSSVDVDNQAQPTVVVPVNDSTVSGTQVLDCVAPSGTGAPVSFDYTGPGIPPQQLGVATPTYYGWIYEWNTKGGANGQYSLYCDATYPFGGGGNSPAILITVSN